MFNRKLMKSTLSIVALFIALSLTRIAFAGEVQLVAFVEARPVGTPIGTWVIGGVTVEVDATTDIDGTDAELQVDYCVELKYDEGGSSNTANEIKAKSRSYCEAVLTVRGLINSFPAGLEGIWTVAGATYSADVNTDFDGPFADGVCVEVKYGETTHIATKIQDRSESDCTLTHVGLVEDRPVGDVIGEWVIGGVSVSADATTIIDGEPEDLALNYCAEAKYLNDGSIYPAVKLESRSRTECETVIKTRGVIHAFPAGLEGTWNISGDSYEADSNTEFKEDKGDFAVGVCVEVTHGTVTSMATKIETDDADDCNAMLVGLIEVRPAGDITGTWTIDGVSMAVDSATVFDGDIDEFAEGYCVEATYFADELTNPAVKLKSKSRTDCEDVLTNRARIDSFPAGLEGTWIIGGDSYVADANTEFKTDRGDYATGVCVEVRYGATTAIAEKIETRNDSDCTGPEQKIVDLIVARQAGDIGPWTVGAVTATATAATMFDGDPSELMVGYCVELKYADDGGTDVATSIKAKDRDDCEAVVKTRGRIDALPVGLLGDWGVAGMTYIVDANTELKEDKGPFELGACVEVTYGSETTIATKVETRDTLDCMGSEMKIVDFIEDRPVGSVLGTWLIGGISAEVDGNTDVSSPDTDLTIGSCAELKYRADCSTNVAMRLEHKNRDACEEYNETRGTIDSFPPALLGDWVIDGVTYTADTETEFKEDKGDFADGVCVQIRYGTESMAAIKIETRNADDCVGPEMQVTDLITLRPGGVMTGTWEVGGVTFEVDDDTLIDGDESQLQLDYCAEVRYVDDGGINFALRLKNKARHYCEPIASAEGMIDSFPVAITGSWVVSGTTYIVDDNTELKEKNGPFAVGACVRVDYGTTTSIATKLETIKECGTNVDDGNMYERVYGTIDSFPVGLIGDWVINGDTYTADAATELKSKKGPLAVGACAMVDYLPSSGLALKIESADSKHCSDDGNGGHTDKDAKLYGLLDSWPAGLIGTWVIDGISYESGLGT